MPRLPYSISYGGHGERGQHSREPDRHSREPDQHSEDSEDCEHRGVSLGYERDPRTEQVRRSLPNPLAKCRRLG